MKAVVKAASGVEVRDLPVPLDDAVKGFEPARTKQAVKALFTS